MFYESSDSEEDGVTLLELVIGITVIGVLAAIAVFGFGEILQTARQRAVESSVSSFGKSILTVRYDANWVETPFKTSLEETNLYSRNNAVFLERLFEAMVIEDGEIVDVNPVDTANLIYALRYGPECTVGFFGNETLAEMIFTEPGLVAYIENGSLSPDDDFAWAAFSFKEGELGLVDRDRMYDVCAGDDI